MILDLSLAFFDSHGGLWVSCPASHPKAKAFGPLGTAREVTPEEARAAGLPGVAYSDFADTDDGAEDGEWGDGWNRPTSTRSAADPATRCLDAISFGPLRTGARSPGRILEDADDLERDGHHREARRERREAAAVLWEHLRHVDQRPSGVSRAQARRWIARVCA